jgi:hypothetical protein
MSTAEPPFDLAFEIQLGWLWLTLLLLPKILEARDLVDTPLHLQVFAEWSRLSEK